MESLLQRWGRCTESRRRAVQAELKEVFRAARQFGKSFQVPKTVQSDVSVLSELSKRLEQMEREVSAHRLEEVRQRQSQMDVGHGKAGETKLRDIFSHLFPSNKWRRNLSLSLYIERLSSFISFSSLCSIIAS